MIATSNLHAAFAKKKLLIHLGFANLDRTTFLIRLLSKDGNVDLCGCLIVIYPTVGKLFGLL